MPQRLEVDPPLERPAFDVLGRGDAGRQGRQRAGQAEVDVAAPQPELPDQAFAGDLLLDPRTGELGAEFLVEGVLAGLLQLVQGAALAELLGEFRGGLGGAERLLHEGDLLVGRDGAVVFPARLGGEPQHGLGGAELRRAEALLGDGGPGGQGSELEQPDQDLALDLQFQAAAEARQGDRRARRQGGLDVVGLGDAELVERGLQAAVLQQRDLDGAVRRERPAEELLDPLLDADGLGLAGDLDDVLAELGVGDRLRGAIPASGEKETQPASIKEAATPPSSLSRGLAAPLQSCVFIVLPSARVPCRAAPWRLVCCCGSPLVTVPAGPRRRNRRARDRSRPRARPAG